MIMTNVKPSDVLIEAKSLFGKFGQRWTRFTLERRGLTGRNYCSLGAIREASDRLKGGYTPCKYAAQRYLRQAIFEETGKDLKIEDFNDAGSLLADMPLNDGFLGTVKGFTTSSNLYV